MRTRKKLWSFGFVGLLAFGAITMQMTILSQFPVRDVVPVYCNLPLTIVIIWGAVFGSPMPPISPDELRMSTTGQIFMRQLLSGSLSGLIVGAIMAALYARVLPVFPIYLPIAGWFSGYFCLRHINKQTLLCMPLTFAVSLLAETIMAAQLGLPGLLQAASDPSNKIAIVDLIKQSQYLQTLMQIGLPEATLNTIIAPFIYFPLRRYYDLMQTTRAVVER